MTDRPKEPELRERIARAQIYRDPAVENDFHADVILMEDWAGNGEWRVEYEDDDGGCYVTIFAGPAAERRALAYFRALQDGRIKIIRAGTVAH